MYELVCVASVYRRGDWSSSGDREWKPRAERRFALAVESAFGEPDVPRTVRVLINDVEVWLTRVEADLMNEVVVTVYSLEPIDGTGVVPMPV